MTEKVPENVLTFADARAIVEQHAAAISAVRVQNVATTEALGRVARLGQAPRKS